MNSGRKKFLMGGMALALAGVLTVGAIMSHVNNVQVEAARNTLDGIERIINGNSTSKPFTILEIVPSRTATVSEVKANGGSFVFPAGTIGYLISGNEPVNIDNILTQLDSDDDRRTFMTKMQAALSPVSDVVSGNKPLTMVSYNEYLSEFLTDEQKNSGNYKKFKITKVVSMNGLSMQSVSENGAYLKRYLVENDDKTINKEAEEFFNSNNKTKFVSANDGDFDPEFGLASGTQSENSGIYSVVFELNTGKKANYRLLSVSESKIKPGLSNNGSGNELDIPINTCLYTENDDKTYSFAGYLVEVDGKVSVNQVPSYTPYKFTTGSVTSLHILPFRAVGNVSGNFEEKTGVSSNDNDEENAGTEGNPEGTEEGDESGKSSQSENKSAVSGDSGSKGAASENSTSDNSASGNKVPEKPETPGEEPVSGVSDNKYYILDFECVKDGSGTYNIKSFERIKEDPGKIGYPYRLKDTNNLVPNYEHKGSVKNLNDTDKCIVYEKTGNGNYNVVKDPASTTKLRLKNIEIYYVGGFTNNEWFKQYVFDRDTQKEYDKLHISVYTVSASSVNSLDVENADLIYLSAGTTEFMPKYDSLKYNDYAAGANDLRSDVSKVLAYQASMRNKPVIVDYQLLKNETLEDTYAWKVAKVLSAKDVKAAYNKYANGYKVDGIETKPDEDKTWVNRNVYIFNDFLHPNDGNTVLNGYFQTVNGDNKSYINDGLTEVLDDIKKTNESRTADKKVAETVHEGTIIRYILNMSKQDILGTKERIRILEIEPTELNFSSESDPYHYPFTYGAYDGRQTLLSGIEYLDNNGKVKYGKKDTLLNLKYDLSVKVSENDVNVLQYTKWDSDDHETKDILSTTGKIEITQMSSAEFIGKIEDLNSEYDMIFIGDDTSGMNHTTIIKTGDDGKPKNWYVPMSNSLDTEYNDATMNGLIYSNVGDYTYVSKKLLGAVRQDYKDKIITNDATDLVGDPYSDDGYKGENANETDEYKKYNSTVGRSRFSGNDLKKTDIDKIIDFARADYPVVFGDNLINVATDTRKRTVNDHCVDNCSHMYELIKKLLEDDGTKDNVFRIWDITSGEVHGAVEEAEKKANGKLFIQSVETLKPEIKISSPTLDSNGHARIHKNDAGNYIIDIKFKIEDVGSGKSSLYAANFYSDLNADGKYATNEELKGSLIRFVDSGGNYANQAELTPGNEYRAICQLDKTYVAGVYPWKLAVSQKENGHRRDSIIGYAVPDDENGENKKIVKVLQITPKNNGRTDDLRLKDRMDMNANPNSSRKSALGYYLNNIPGFELKVEQIPTNTLVLNTVKNRIGREPGVNDFLEFFREYDLIILGFTDRYEWGNGNTDISNKAAEGLLGYIAEGNSVLFSHDTTSYWNVMKQEGTYPADKYMNGSYGYSINQYIRNIVGMNRYGVRTDAGDSENEVVQKLLRGQKFDTIYQPRSNRSGESGKGISLIESQSHGIAAFSLIRGSYDRSKWKLNWMEPEDRYNDNDSGHIKYYSNHIYSRISNTEYNNAAQTNAVRRVNRGQITEYPYVLPPYFNVSDTHGQYYQLNLELDDDNDGESDVVVWYTLGGINGLNNKYVYNLYNMSGKDVRNNYFIYNRGNVTYTGQGHSEFKEDYDTYDGDPANAKDANECKLLVNTIIAAYSAGARESQVSFHETGSAMSKKMKSDIIPYDILYNMTENKNESYFPGAERKVSGNTATDPIMTAYIEISDTNVVFSKKIYAKFSRKPNASLETGDDNQLQPLEVISVTPLTDEGEPVPAGGYHDVNSTYNSSTGEFLLYDSTNSLDYNAVNAGKMFKVVYSLKGYNIANPDTPPVGVTNMPGVAVTTRTELQRKEEGVVTQKTAEDDLMLIRTQLFNLK